VLVVDGERLFRRDALVAGNFEVIVSGSRKGTGSSRETAAQAEVWAGIRIAVASSFAPIHARNQINLGTLLAGYGVLRRLERGEGVPLAELCQGYYPLTRLVIGSGGLFPFVRAVAAGEIALPAATTGPRPMTMTEKILARHQEGGIGFVAPGEPVVVRVDGGYSHEFTTAQVHAFLTR